jgi:hypothetical protein
VESAAAVGGIAASAEVVVDGSMASTTSSSSVTAVFTMTSEVGGVVASCNAIATTVATAPGDSQFLTCKLHPSSPLELWSTTSPTLYTVQVDLMSGIDVVDSTSWSTGFRNAVFAGHNGLTLNSEPVKLRGFSHHDSFVACGVAMPPRLDLFRAQASRALGSNVWRMSHNPYHTPLYEILDAVGTAVWDENRDLGPWYADGMGVMVKRDRNHPSVLLWSFCNEYECGQNSNKTGLMFRSAALAEDQSRPLTSNINGAFISGVDVQGFSHKSASSLENFHSLNPSTPQVLSECCSCETQRLPVQSRKPSDGCMRSENSGGLLPFDIGSLGVWTLFDYFGESHTWPNYACAFGQFDIAGSPKPHAWWYVVNWLQLYPEGPGRPSLPKVDVARILDLPDQLDCSSTGCTVTAITTTMNAELLLNGTVVGTQIASMLGNQVQFILPFPDAATNGVQHQHKLTYNCSFPINLTGVQCKDLNANKHSKTLAACASACCQDSGCNVWQFDVVADKGCWMGYVADPSQAR